MQGPYSEVFLKVIWQAKLIRHMNVLVKEFLRTFFLNVIHVKHL